MLQEVHLSIRQWYGNTQVLETQQLKLGNSIDLEIHFWFRFRYLLSISCAYSLYCVWLPDIWKNSINAFQKRWWFGTCNYLGIRWIYICTRKECQVSLSYFHNRVVDHACYLLWHLDPKEKGESREEWNYHESQHGFANGCHRYHFI